MTTPPTTPTTRPSSPTAPTRSGLDLDWVDPGTRPQDDLFGHVNGTWLDTEDIPADRSSWGPFVQLADIAEEQVRAIIVELAAGDADGAVDAEAEKIGVLYNSFMDTETIAKMGLRPVQPLITAVAALRDIRDLAAFVGEFERIGGAGLFGSYVDTDRKDSDRYLVYLVQGGLGLPDESYYRDKILDVDDLCPLVPEDFDGFEDEDGCPDLDNDGDRIADKDDRCPNEPETYNNVDDKDGCPDKDDPRAVIIETDGTIDVLKPINFEYDKAKIKRDSYYILDAIAAALQGNSTIQLLEIAGHTDERGDDAYNLDLSDRRAAAVLRYLTGKGVDPKRLESQGYGETRPKDPRSTPAAYAKNRRVEFVILRKGK
jgi:outer membrane protein OmpA-like peptidoglycan-associated protein